MNSALHLRKRAQSAGPLLCLIRVHLRSSAVNTMMMKSSVALGVLALEVALALALPAAAQTGPELLLKPFPRERTLETRSDVVLIHQGETDNADADFQLTL